MDFKEDYILENDFVQLRPLQAADLQHLLHFSLEQPELWKYSLSPASSEAELKAYIDAGLKGREDGVQYPFLVFDKTCGDYAGSTRFYDIKLKQKCLQLGYTWYGKKFQGTGLNKHCKYLLLEFAFEKLGMERVEFRADNENERSIAAMKSVGCTVEGVLRSNGFKQDGTRRDSIVLSVLKEEWLDGVKKNLQAKCKPFSN